MPSGRRGVGAFSSAAGGLAPPLDANCSIATRTDYVYRSTTGPDLKPLPAAGAVPADAAIVAVNGKRIPYVVRIETATVNRAIYQIAMLHTASDPAPDFTVRSPGWNGRLISYAEHGDWNGDDYLSDVQFPKRITLKRGTSTLADLTLTKINTYNPYVVMTVPEGQR